MTKIELLLDNAWLIDRSEEIIYTLSDSDMTELFRFLALDTGAKPIKGYVWAALGGSPCWAMVGDDAIDIIENASRYGLSGAQFTKRDGQYTVYWPELRS